MLEQLLFDDVGDRRIAGTGQPGAPEHARALQLVLGSLQSMQFHFVPGEIVAVSGLRLLVQPGGLLDYRWQGAFKHAAGFHLLAPGWVFRFRQH